MSAAEYREGILLVVSGPSGAGKGTVCKHYLAAHPDTALSVSVTTRAPRPGEVEGVNYFFKTREEFQEMITQNAFLEYAQVYGNYYGTPRQYVCALLGMGRDVILEIDPQGAIQVIQRFPQGVSIFIAPPSLRALRARLSGRATETEEVMERRFGCAKAEIELMQRYQYVVVNDDAALAAARMGAIVDAEHCRTHRNKQIQKRLLEGADIV